MKQILATEISRVPGQGNICQFCLSDDGECSSSRQNGCMNFLPDPSMEATDETQN